MVKVERPLICYISWCATLSSETVKNTTEALEAYGFIVTMDNKANRDFVVFIAPINNEQLVCEKYNESITYYFLTVGKSQYREAHRCFKASTPAFYVDVINQEGIIWAAKLKEGKEYESVFQLQYDSQNRDINCGSIAFYCRGGRFINLYDFVIGHFDVEFNIIHTVKAVLNKALVMLIK